MKRQLIVSMALIVFASAVIPASTISIGVFSFDVFVAPANGSPGLNAISISEFTGTFDLPPDFPVTTDLALINATPTVEQSGGPPQVISLGNIGPGALLAPDGNPLLVLQFPSTTNFTSSVSWPCWVRRPLH
jgi:hypothetical protein